MNTGKFSCFGFAAILRKLLGSLFCLPDDRADRRFFHDLIISPKAKRIVKIIRNFCPLISRLISDSFHSQQLHGSQCSDDLWTCVFIIQFLFKQTIDQKWEITYKEVRFYLDRYTGLDLKSVLRMRNDSSISHLLSLTERMSLTLSSTRLVHTA